MRTGRKIKNMKRFSLLLLILVSGNLYSQPLIVAHRGASYLAPENTVASANLAWELGADAVEIDVYRTFDHRIMVIHDQTTRRVSAGAQNLEIAGSFSADLRAIDVGAWKDARYRGEKIPFLSEIIATVPEGKRLVVEIKAGKEILPDLQKEFESCGKLDQALFISFGWETILEAKKRFPENRCYWLSSSKQAVTERMELAAQHGLDGVNLSHKIIDKEVVEMARNHGLEVLAWTVNDPEIAKTMIELGVSAITTDRPAWLRDALKKN